MKRFIVGMVALMFCLFVLSGCGGGGSGSSSTGVLSDETSTTGTTTTTTTGTTANTTGAPGTPTVVVNTTTGTTATLGNLVLSVDTDMIPADGVTAATVTVTTYDTTGALLGGVPFYIGDSPNVIAEASSETTSIGTKSFSVKTSTPGNVTLTITSGTITKTLTIHVGPYLILAPSSVAAIGEANLMAILKDATHTPMAGELISFGFGESNPFPMTESATTDSQGVAWATVSDPLYQGGSATVIASSGKITSNTSAVEFSVPVAGAAGEEAWTLSATTTNKALISASTATITASTIYTSGLPRGGQALTISAKKADGSASSVTFDSTTATTDTKGEATFKVTGSNENVILTVAVGALTKVDIPLYFGAKLRLYPETGESVADGTTKFTLSAYLQDYFGGALSGIPVTFGVQNDGNALIGQPQTLTDATGKATVDVFDFVEESVAIQASSGNLPPYNSVITFGPGTAASLTLTTDPPAPISLSLGGEATITATVRDALGNLVKDNTPVNFATSGIGTITASAFTVDGVAEASFSAGTVAGFTTITVSSGAASSQVDIVIQGDSTAGSLTLESVNPSTIYTLGTQDVQTSTIIFMVRDFAGNPVADGTPVEFSLGDTTLGGELLSVSVESQYNTVVTGETTNGYASVTLRSGYVSGTTDVVARVNTTGVPISTIARVSVVGGHPDARHLSLSFNPLNLAGAMNEDGLEDEVILRIGDRFGNVVRDGTAANFMTDCGVLGTSEGFDQTTTDGSITSTWITQTPRQSDGRCTVIAYLPGSESFDDVNGNGIFDEGVDNCYDLAEPYLDLDESNGYSAADLYVDVNKDGNYDAVGDGKCQLDALIWTEGTAIWGSRNNIPLPNIAPAAEFKIDIGERKTFSYNMGDENGNALPSGSTANVTTTAGTLSGTTSYTMPDRIATTETYQFTLAAGTASSAEPQRADVTVKISPAGTTDIVEQTLSGWINVPSVPSVVMTSPADGQSSVSKTPTIEIIFDSAMEYYSAISAVSMKDAANNPVSLTGVGSTGKIEAQKQFEYTPSTTLTGSTDYTVTVSTSVKDVTNTALTAPYVFSFQTAP